MPRWIILLLLTVLPAAADRGAIIYTEHCASCHGDQGQGVAGEYDEALVGKKNIPSLAKYIHRNMPEDNEDAVIDEDARLVSKYIHRSFYSPEAQTKLKPVRRDLLRRTRHQHKHALADLVADFRWRPFLGEKHGLKGHYFNKEKMNDRKHKLAERIDERLRFDLTSDHRVDGVNPDGFSIFWNGSLLPPETGTYQFRVKTPNGARLWLNALDHKEPPILDAWVSSANKMREASTSIYLLGGHAIPIFLEFLSFKEKTSSILFEWKPPHGTWQEIPKEHLYPDSSPKVAISSTSFPADDASLGYERGSSISKAWKTAVSKSAIEITGQIFADIDQLSGTKAKAANRNEKLRQFCATFARRAFARPLSDSQRKIYIDDIFTQSASNSETAVKRSLMLTLTSPYFLYPSLNLNSDGKPDAHTRVAHLALLIWDSLPDPQLRDAAEKDYFKYDDNFNAQVERMLWNPRAKEKMSRFFFQWLHLTEKDDLTKDKATFPGFDESVIADLRSSFTGFTNQVVWSKESDYRQLFKSPSLPLNPQLLKLYKPGSNPAGLLTHPYILTAFAYHKQTSPIHRGVYLSRNVLGRFLKPPPNAIEFKDSDFKPDLTMREKVTELTKDSNCMACHSIINPIGFSLENYDAIGRFRTHEKEKPIDTTSEYPDENDKVSIISGPTDLARLAIESPGAQRAFIKHLFHHLVQQPLPGYGGNTTNQVHDSFISRSYNIRDLIRTIAKTTQPK